MGWLGDQWERMKQEVGQTLKDKFLHGLDELGNALFHGSGYMPWPGKGRPTIQQEAQHIIQVQDAVTDAKTQAIMQAYETQRALDEQRHNNLYMSNKPTYEDVVAQYTPAMPQKQQSKERERG